jgi:hypothetical protein
MSGPPDYMHMCDCAFCDSCGEEVGDTLVHVRVPIKRHKKEREVIEAAKAARLPIERMLRAHGQPNTTIAELLVRVENLLAAEGVE